MEDVVVRSRYPRRTVPGRRRRRSFGEKRNLARLLSRQTAACLILLLIIGMIRLVDLPVTNYVTDKIQFALKQNIELSSIYKYLVNTSNSIRDSIFPSEGSDTGTASSNTGETNGAQDADQPADQTAKAADTNDAGGLSSNAPASGDKAVNGAVPTGQISANQTANDQTADKAGKSSASQETAVLGVSTEEGSASGTVMISPAAGLLSSTFTGGNSLGIGNSKAHEGIDIETEKGAGIAAVLDGKVIETGSSPAYGNYIKVKHDNVYTTVYAHCSSLLATTGQQVKQGDIIARVGDGGAAVGVHLHFEIWKNGVPVDPLDYISIPEK